MAIKIYGDKIVFPDNTEQTTSAKNIWKDNGSSVEFNGDGSTTTQVWAESNGKYAKVIQKNDGSSYFTGDGATFFGTESDLPVNIFVGGTNKLAVGKDSIYAFHPLTAPEFIGDGSKLTGLPPSGIPEAPIDGETYARNNATWVGISASSGIPDAPVDGLMYGRQDGEWNPVADAGDVYTKTEIDAQQEAQDADIIINNDEIARQQIEITNNSASIVKNDGDINKNILDIATNTAEIAKKANTADTYTKTQTDTLLDNKANVGDSYTKAETYNNTEIDSKLFEKADKTTTYTKEEVDDSQDAQDLNISSNTTAIGTNATNIATNTSNISSNTTAIGTLSGQVAQNSEDIAELQDSIFFTSAYSADYPSTPNRDPEDGNMYLQNLALFTYSYAEATQIFVSKTDESGNVRQFTAVQAGDSIVLNQVESPNYGRYELVSIEDVSGSYVVMNVIPKLGEGTVIEGVKIAFQAFPKPATVDSYSKAESDAINDAQDVNISANTTAIATKVGEAPEDGKQYARKDATWSEVTGGESPWTQQGNDLVYTNNNNGFYINTAGSNSVNIMNYNGSSFGDIWLRGTASPDRGVGCLSDGRVMMPDVASTSTADTPNLVISSDGQIVKSTTATYSAEEVDNRLAIKDKLIEKLSARLDSLELEFKALK